MCPRITRQDVNQNILTPIPIDIGFKIGLRHVFVYSHASIGQNLPKGIF